MAEMNIAVCNRQNGCKIEYGEFGPEADRMVAQYAEYQTAFMGNEADVKDTCSQTCGVLAVKLSDLEIDGKIVTGVRVSGVTRNGKVLNDAPGVGYQDENGHFKTQLIK